MSSLRNSVGGSLVATIAAKSLGKHFIIVAIGLTFICGQALAGRFTTIASAVSGLCPMS